MLCRNQLHDLSLPGAVVERNGWKQCRECERAKWRRASLKRGATAAGMLAKVRWHAEHRGET